MTHKIPTLAKLDDFAQLHLAHVPTPLEEMVNLSDFVGGAQMFVKRDDCTGLGLGGNKVRQVEFYLGDASEMKADTILITGAVQSNYVRIAAAAARKLGMDIHIQLERRVARKDRAYRNSGNVLLDRILGATLHVYPEADDEGGADERLERIAERLQAKGRKPYVIHLSRQYRPLGALGYVCAARELVDQVSAMNLNLDEVVVASGSGHTHAGLLFGLRAVGCQARVTGVCVRRTRQAQSERIRDHCSRIAQLLAVSPMVSARDIHLIDEFVAPGYGMLNTPTIESIKLAARHEGLLLDPVYTGKAMAGAIRRARSLGRGKRLVFLHTGGSPAIFGYEPVLTNAMLGA